MRINEAVGQFLKQYRADHGLTLDDVATASRRYGSGWIAASVRNIEHGGGKADSLPVLILLVQSLNDLTHGDMTLADLFYELGEFDTSISDMDLTDSVVLPASGVANILNGERFQLVVLPKIGTPEWSDYMNQVYGEARDYQRVRAYPPLRDAVEQSAIEQHVPTSAEGRAASKIDVPTDMFGAWCIHLYGHSLDEEAARRAGEGASPQKRGRATRVITEEVSKAIEAMVDWRTEAAVNGDL